MPGPPETRNSLIARLPAAGPSGFDEAAWQEFVVAYEPFLYSFARRHGMQDSDAMELVQLVLLSVARSVEGWQPAEPGRPRPKFRSWLRTIARNHLLNQIKAKSRQPCTGGTTILRQVITAVGGQNDGGHDDDENVYRREVFVHCATKVKCEVKPETWQAFWLTAVDGNSCAAAASELGISIGSVYAARTRVLAKLKGAVELFLRAEEISDAKGESA